MFYKIEIKCVVFISCKIIFINACFYHCLLHISELFFHNELSTSHEGTSSSLARALNRPDPAGCTALMHACSPPPSPNEEEGLKSVDNDSGSSNEEVMLATCSLLISYGALPGQYLYYSVRSHMYILYKDNA